MLPDADRNHPALEPLRPGDALPAWLFPALFGTALLSHSFLVTRNWQSGNLVGQEFRQTQTALSALFIRKDHDFSLAYPTPVLGKPWSMPMEFPLYQWGVVRLADATGWPLAVAARTVTLACFYASLPAWFLLLGSLGVPAIRRWLVLALVLTCPLYIFYSRAFLIESMALCFASWFLVAYVRWMQRPQAGWLALCAVAGTGAALVKVTTLIAWLLPAAVWSTVLLWNGQFRRPRVRLVLRGAAAVVLPGLAAVWWVDFSDAIKAVHPSAHEMTSHSLRRFNFGAPADRFSAEIWGAWLAHWRTTLIPAWLALGPLVLGLLLRRPGLRPALVCLGTFLAAQLIFPRLYFLHDYYYYAIGVLLAGTAGLALLVLLDRRGPIRWLGLLLVPALIAVQMQSYFQAFYPEQRQPSNGGSSLTAILHALTPEGSVLVVAGWDWSSTIPYYAERRALMIRNGLEYNAAYLDQAFAALKEENISALVLLRDQRTNPGLLARAATAFDLDRSITFSLPDADVYLNNSYRQGALLRLAGDRTGYAAVTYQARPVEHPAGRAEAVQTVTPGLRTTVFKHMSPAPVRYRFAHELGFEQEDGGDVLGAHPDSDLWFVPPAGSRQIECEFGLHPAAYQKSGDRTDGVEFIIALILADGTTRELFHRLLDPERHPADGGRQQAVIPFAAPPGTELVFMTRPNGNSAYDWSYWGRIGIK